jgi:nitroreductase
MRDKTAVTDHAISEVLAKRWSPRAFADKPVTNETISQLFEAARWAPSAFNEQPWRFMVATKEHPTEYQKVLSCLVEFNQMWAQSAPVLLIVVASENFERNGKPNHHAWYDTGQAMATLTVQATILDLYIHQMAGFSPEKARETFNIPAGYEAIAAAAIGYMGDADQLPDQMRQGELAPRTRKALSEVLFSGTWGQSSEIVGA